MAGYGWGTEHSVEEWLFGEGHRFDFYQAVRMLELLYPERSPVGESADPATEVVRFKSAVSLAFPASEIGSITPSVDGEPASMVVNFLGLAGLPGPLPISYTELVLERVWAKDLAMKDFLDLFNHRLVSLMHRARKLHRVGLDFKSPEQSHLAPYLFSLIGLETKGLKGRLGVSDRSLLYYAGLLAGKPRSMAGLERIIGDYFDTAVVGTQMRGRWLELEEPERTKIGFFGANNRLGVDAALGGRVWDQQGAFELRLRSLRYERLLDFLPGGAAFGSLMALTRFYAGDELEVELALEVEPRTVPGIRLGAGARLGWTTWMAGDGDDAALPAARLSFTRRYHTSTTEE
jgi:type VI secretion system protein ImpH